MALTWDELGTILRRAKTIAVVGLSNNPERTSHEIASYLKDTGYRIIPVNPTITEALGAKAYPSLRDIAEKIDAVLIFRRPSEVPAIIDDAIAVGGRVVWMQPGAENEEAAAKAEAAGFQVVVGACMRSVHQMLRV